MGRVGALLTLFTKGNFLAGFLVGWDSLYEIGTSEFFSRKWKIP